MKNLSEQIEKIYADKAGKTTTSRKCIADYWETPNVAVNVKSNDIHKENFLPRLVSCRPVYDFLKDPNNQLKFIFVYYDAIEDLKIVNESQPIYIEELDWDCLSINCQGDGFIAMKKKCVKKPILRSKVDRITWMSEFKTHYASYIQKEQIKLQRNLSYFS